MSEIIRNTDPEKGPVDCVELEAMCAYSHFTRNKNGVAVGMKSQSTSQCKIMASYETGVVSVLVKNVGENEDGDAVEIMVAVLIDEIMALLHAASIAAAQRKEESDAEEDTTPQG